MKALNQEEVDSWRAECKANGWRVGYTCGAFDILHAGHVDYLEKARLLCDRLLVAVNSDTSIQQYKSAVRPINPESERVRVIGALRCVDAVTILDEPRPISQLQRWRPELYIKGGDYSANKLRSSDAVRSYGGEVVVIEVLHPTSSSTVIDRILAAAVHVAPDRIHRTTSGIVFVDRDGTLIPDLGFLKDPERVELLPGVGEGLARLRELDFRLVIATNQQGIGLGYYTEQEFIKVNQALFQQLSPYGVKIDRVAYCPHSVADDCDCRKPGALLLTRAMEYFGTAADDCYMIGDRLTDVEAGKAAGCTSILLSTGAAVSEDCFVAPSFAHAVDWIADRQSKRSQVWHEPAS